MGYIFISQHDVVLSVIVIVTMA